MLYLLVFFKRERSSVVEHPSDKGKAEGSIPSARTSFFDDCGVAVDEFFKIR